MLATSLARAARAASRLACSAAQAGRHGPAQQLCSASGSTCFADVLTAAGSGSRSFPFSAAAAAALRASRCPAAALVKQPAAQAPTLAALAQASRHTGVTLSARVRGFAAQCGPSRVRAGVPVPLGLRVALPARAGQRRPATTLQHVAGAASSGAASHASQSVSPLVAGLSSGTRRALAGWLGVCSAWVFSMVVLGGITRLTRSGLSMTEWKFTGEQPPRTEAEWAAEFAKYRASPEYKRVNRGMDVEEFKFIYWMEYAHRMWGRVLGLVFALPAAYFAARGAINGPLARRLALLFAMGGTQGLVGWWMVRSGLEEPQQAYEVPRVSPYRLAAHLMSAFTIYAVLLWTTLQVALPTPPTATATAAAVQGARSVRRLALPVAGLVAVTAASGAFVAGLDAGHAYNTFPTMNGEWVPSEYWAMPGWRNMFESTAAVQLHHRVLALSTLGSVAALWSAGQRMPLPRPSRLLLHGLLAAVGGQVALGVLTLLNCVPVSLGSAHQAGALTVFSIALGLLYSVRPFPHLSPFGAAAGFLTPAAMASVVALGGAVVNVS